MIIAISAFLPAAKNQMFEGFTTSPSYPAEKPHHSFNRLLLDFFLNVIILEYGI